IIIIPSVHKLNKRFSHSAQKSKFADDTINQFSDLISLLLSRSSARIILTNFQELNDGIFGNYSNKTDQSFLYHIRRINVELMTLAIKQPNLFIADAQNLFSNFGMTQAFDAKLFIHGDIIYSLDFLAALAQNTSGIIASIQGDIKKCIVLDLDNTLWGGVIGDDGIENIQIGDLGIGKAFSMLQNWLYDLKNRGIILAVCSKNTESVAKEVFEKHPGMTLRLNDISVFVANWETKVDNILFIQSVLNIGFDSMVFLDDNPFEREIVKKHIPGIEVPDLPEDPSEYVWYLRSLNLFETASFSGEDLMRTKQYQEEATRLEFQKLFTNERDFLASLDMKAVIKPVDNFNCPRIAQLTQRSNQFNLRTIRYTDEDIKRIMHDPDYKSLTVTLEDKYGDYGLISAVILRLLSSSELFIDTWIMSCRVLKRGVELCLLNEMVTLGLESGYKFLVGEYIPTPKNGMVKNHYEQLGFRPDSDGRYYLELTNFNYKDTVIHKSGKYVNS
ncbi:MAG TPA: HAD-IIIC family phosphatase, partial [Flavitalea sp.]|nr:HAD-IIIC family phosphatase [Flavitalea sp.]